jgi:Methane oxygenase PmoA
MIRTVGRVTLASLLFSLGPAVLHGVQEVELKHQGDQIEVFVGGKAFTTYYFGSDSPKPYLHPLRSAQGTVVTRGWPMVKDIPGESHDHPHHRAMFFAHGDINGIDFWGEGEPSRTSQTAHGQFYSSEELPKGRTVFRELDEATGGIIRAEFDLVGPDGKVMGEETQQYTFSGDESTRTIDCAFTLFANHGPLKMGDTKEGTFAIRVVKALEAPAGHMSSSEGKTGEKEIWGKRADWVDYSGTVAGEALGIAIFDNPGNIKHPTYWHARAYGLFAVNPFGEHDFYNDPKRDGSVTIQAGGSLMLRYRVLIHHGDATEAKVAEKYEEYAHSTTSQKRPKPR